MYVQSVKSQKIFNSVSYMYVAILRTYMKVLLCLYIHAYANVVDIVLITVAIVSL